MFEYHKNALKVIRQYRAYESVLEFQCFLRSMCGPMVKVGSGVAGSSLQFMDMEQGVLAKVKTTHPPRIQPSRSRLLTNRLLGGIQICSGLII